jgi:poly(3-hydroxybutyrate) depolymerase
LTAVGLCGNVEGEVHRMRRRQIVWLGLALVVVGCDGGKTPDGAGTAGATGGAGTSGAAGETAMAGTGDAAGETGSAGGTAGSTDPGGAGATGAVVGARPSGPSAGCNAEPPGDAIGKAMQHDLTVSVAAKYVAGYTARKYFTTLPTGWEPTKPYPVLFYGPGCGATTAEGSPWTGGTIATNYIYAQLLPATVTSQTVVPSNAAPGCFQAGKAGLSDSPDGPYFDQALAEIEAKYCVDRGKIYVSGWSSGGWLAPFLACSRGNVVKGVVIGAGGLFYDHGPCTGGAAVMWIPATGDGENGIVDVVDGHDIGSGQGFSIFVKANACSAASQAWTPTNNVALTGCNAPLRWNPVGGGHGASLTILATEGWKFLSALP